MTLKVVFCWSDISGYMAACWRALQQQPDIELFVVAFQAQTESAFAAELMQGIPCRLLNLEERQDASLVAHLVTAQQPDVVVLCGWFHPPYRRLPAVPGLKDTAFVLGMDTPWWGSWKQRTAPWLLRSFLKKIDHTVVTGERSWQYARRLGLASARISRGLYGIDAPAWGPLYEQRRQAGWPKSFLFVGRYAPAKSVDVLLAAYRQYRDLTADPWPLVCCGQGPLGQTMTGQPGLANHGFVQPDQMVALWRQAGAFILPSRFDPWPLALVEAAAAGLPVICTDACGSAVEVVRDRYNGRLIPPEDSTALALAMLDLHRRYDDLPAWGRRSQELATPYAADLWAERWQTLLAELRTAKMPALTQRPARAAPLLSLKR